LQFAHTQDCTNGTANDKTGVIYLTLSMEGDPTASQRDALEDAVRVRGGSVIWRSSATTGRSYASLALPVADNASPLPVPVGATLYEKAIIALAVFPAIAEALPPLVAALDGTGRPAGMLACHAVPGGVALEWDPRVSSAAVVLGLVDVELKRFASGRRAELLAPLPPEITTQIAAESLHAAEIVPDRVLELKMGADRV
jgi:hypothetical protein